MQVFEDKLLTIAIPTYNRPEKLKDQVSLLLKQVTDQVEILILDNCSSYNIYQLFSKEERQRIHIVTHKVNVGMPTNYIPCSAVRIYIIFLQKRKTWHYASI